MLVVLLYIQNVVDAFLVLGELGWMVLLCVCLCVHSGYLPWYCASNTIPCMYLAW